MRGFLPGTSADPDPLLVITADGVTEYVDSKKPVAVVGEATNTRCCDAYRRRSRR